MCVCIFNNNFYRQNVAGHIYFETTLSCLTSPVDFLLENNVLGSVREKDGIVLCTEVHSDEERWCASDRKDDVLLRREVKRDPSHCQLTGEEQELPHSCNIKHRAMCFKS